MKIFLDMDQVLVDFIGGTQKILGENFENATGDPFAEEARTQKVVYWTFWEELPPMPDYHILWEFVKEFDPYILSASPSWKDPHVWRGKRAWIKQYLGIPEHRIHIVPRAEKENFAMHGDVQNLLIDDRKDNCTRFIEAGGCAIVHTSANTTIIELKNILNR